MDTVPSTRNVLLEDYTGIQCGNCPPAALEAQRLKANAGGRLVVISVHAGGFAIPAPPGSPHFTEDLRSPEGTQIYEAFSIPGTPRGTINRMMANVNGLDVQHFRWADWEAVLNTALALPEVLKLHATATVNSQTRQIRVNVNAKAIAALPEGNQYLNVYIIEEGIETAQKWYNHTPETVDPYEQHAVMRGAAAGAYGQLLGTGTLAVGQQVAQAATLTAAQNWNLNKLYALVFVANGEGKNVQQVIKVPIQVVN
jgi:hypothetical protein